MEGVSLGDSVGQVEGDVQIRGGRQSHVTVSVGSGEEVSVELAKSPGIYHTDRFRSGQVAEGLLMVGLGREWVRIVPDKDRCRLVGKSE